MFNLSQYCFSCFIIFSTVSCSFSFSHALDIITANLSFLVIYLLANTLFQHFSSVDSFSKMMVFHITTFSRDFFGFSHIFQGTFFNFLNFFKGLFFTTNNFFKGLFFFSHHFSRNVLKKFTLSCSNSTLERKKAHPLSEDVLINILTNPYSEPIESYFQFFQGTFFEFSNFFKGVFFASGNFFKQSR